MNGSRNGEPPLHEELVSAYLDDELDAPTRARVEAWLTESAEIRAVLDEVAATRGALRALPLLDAPPEFWTRLLAQPGAADSGPSEDAEVATLADRRPRLGRRTKWATAVAAVAAAVAVPVVAIPQPSRVKPPVATFRDVHAARASVTADAVSNLAPVALRLPRSR